MDREGQLIDATESTVRLFPDRDETDYIELRGDAKVTGGPKANALRSMTARDINLDYADDGRTLQNATLAGTAAIQLATKDGSSGQRLGGEFMEIGLEPDGSVRSLSTRDARHRDAAGHEGHRRPHHSLERADRRRQRAGPPRDEVHRGRRVPRGGHQDAGRANRQGARASKRSSTRPPARCKRRSSSATSTSPTGRCAPSATRRVYNVDRRHARADRARRSRRRSATTR